MTFSPDTIDLESVEYGLLTEIHAPVVSELINASFEKDAFFKKAEYVKRSSPESALQSARKGLENKNIFLVGTALNTVDGARVPITAINVTWKEDVQDNKIIKVTGEFGTVSVWPELERRGLGKTLVIAAEKFLLNKFCELNSVQPECHSKLDLSSAVHTSPSYPFPPAGENCQDGCVMEMIVLNVRQELVPWYSRQNYIIVDDQIPFPDSYKHIVQDGIEIICTLMRKTLM